jgi:arylsulfatase A-like enzyme
MILRKLLLFPVLLILLSCMQNQQVEQPNIIFILADDLGAGDLHCTGHPYAATPYLDQLAEQGIRFDRAYMAAAWCAPSRYGIMSGQFPARNFDRTRNLKPGEPSVTQMLKDANYNTAHFGKWHMTEGTEYSDTPADFGINEHFLHNYKGGDANTWSGEEKKQEYWRATTTDAYVDLTIDFIRRNKATDRSRPFYVNLWVYPTHSYINPTPEQLEVYEGLEVNIDDFSPYQQEFLGFVSQHGDIDKAMQAYCADVTAMDRALGRLFDFLKSENLDDNTLIVFTSDNGPGPLTHQVQTGSVVERYHERPDLLNSVGSAKIYRERKTSLHEGGIRVPFIVSWPGNTPEGKVDRFSVIHGTDWLPTVASICGIPLPDGTYDGADVSHAFLGEESKRQKDLYWTQSGDVAILTGHWKGILTKEDEFKLYDIIKDPEELHDLKVEYPEQADKMKDRIQEWSQNIRSAEES